MAQTFKLFQQTVALSFLQKHLAETLAFPWWQTTHWGQNRLDNNVIPRPIVHRLIYHWIESKVCWLAASIGDSKTSLYCNSPALLYFWIEQLFESDFVSHRQIVFSQISNKTNGSSARAKSIWGDEGISQLSQNLGLRMVHFYQNIIWAVSRAWKQHFFHIFVNHQMLKIVPDVNELNFTIYSGNYAFLNVPQTAWRIHFTEIEQKILVNSRKNEIAVHLISEFLKSRRCFSFSKGVFPGSMLVSRGVYLAIWIVDFYGIHVHVDKNTVRAMDPMGSSWWLDNPILKNTIPTRVSGWKWS